MREARELAGKKPKVLITDGAWNLKKVNTPILKGYQIYHNYLRPHEALKGKTLAQACGIEVEGKNKWITIIQNASESKTNRI